MASVLVLLRASVFFCRDVGMRVGEAGVRNPVFS